MSFAAVLYNAAKSGGINSNNDNWYEKMSILYREKGATFDTRPEWRNVMAIRTFTPINRENKFGVFDDVILVAWSTKKGARLMLESFSANTDPSFQYMDGRNEGIKKKENLIRDGKSNEGQDANEDGLKDLGMLPPGIYQYNASIQKHAKLKLIFRPISGSDKGVRVYRDTNRDGYYNQADENIVKNQDLMYEGNTMYIHSGSATNTYSAGCQTMPSDEFLKFRTNIANGVKYGRQDKFTYLLVNTW
jgi:hypothetical protein